MYLYVIDNLSHLKFGVIVECINCIDDNILLKHT